MKPIGIFVAAVAAALALVPAAVVAQDHYTYTLSALGGVGGSLGDDNAGLGNESFALGLSLLREDSVHISLRLGQVEFDAQDRIGNLNDASLSYLVAGGEYRFLESFYESGLFIGLGAYDFEGTDLEGRSDSESNVGLVLGASGEFEINRRFGFVIEILGHVTGLESNATFATGHAGIAVHF